MPCINFGEVLHDVPLDTHSARGRASQTSHKVRSRVGAQLSKL